MFLVQLSLQLLQLEGVRGSSVLTLLCYQLAERVMNTFLVYWAPDSGTHDGHKNSYKDTGSEIQVG